MSLIFWSQNHLRRASEKFSSDIYLYTKIWSSNIRRYLRENADTRKTFFFQIRLSNNRNFFELFLPPHHSVLTHDMCVQMLECSIRSGIVQSFYDSSFQSHSWLKSISNLINHLLYWAEDGDGGAAKTWTADFSSLEGEDLCHTSCSYFSCIRLMWIITYK